MSESGRVVFLTVSNLVSLPVWRQSDEHCVRQPTTFWFVGNDNHFCLHAAAGVGMAMGSLVNAQSPLVKWSFEAPDQASVPAVTARAAHTATAAPNRNLFPISNRPEEPKRRPGRMNWSLPMESNPSGRITDLPDK